MMDQMARHIAEEGLHAAAARLPVLWGMLLTTPAPKVGRAMANDLVRRTMLIK